MGCCSAKLNEVGNYDPSPFTLFMATKSKSDYSKQEYDVKYTGTKPILVICTDDGAMKMENGKIFNTGNHPIEMLVPMLHFRNAGFTFDVATTTGKPVVLEMWAFPNKDDEVKAFHAEVKSMMDAPKKIEDIKDLSAYSAVFIPGGHGCMINLPFNAALGKLLHMAHERALPTVTLCHGPGALLSTRVEGAGNGFAYKGYKTMCFTDKTDAFTPNLGYLPGNMPWKCQQSLEQEGMTVENTGESGAVTSDRELITGDSPNAGNNLGKFAAPLLVKYALENKL